MINSFPLYRASSQRGLSLIELMVSILLGVVLSSGIIAVYLDSKRNYAAEEDLARIQENGRFALDLLKRELTLAGFYGGYFIATDLAAPTSGDEEVDPDCIAGGQWALDVSNAIDMVDDFDEDDGWVTATGATLADCVPASANVQPGTDVLTVKRSAGEPSMYEATLVNDAAAKSGQMYLQVEDYGETREWYYSTSTSFATDPNTIEFWEIYAKLFYVRNYSVTVGDNIPTLCVRQLNGNAMSVTDRCLVEGVEDMQIQFGVDSDGDNIPNLYTPDPNEMNTIVTARIYLLMRGLTELVGTQNANTKTYQLGPDASNAVTVSDGYLRRIFSSTVQVRNSILPAG